MAFPEKVYIVSETGCEWDIILGVFKHRPDAVEFQQKFIEKNESMIMWDLSYSIIKLTEHEVK